MNKADAGIGLGLAGLMALCCGGPLLLVLAVPLLALLTGQLVVIAAAVLVLLVVGIVAWRRRVHSCAAGACAANWAVPAGDVLETTADAADGFASPEPVAAGSEDC